MSETVITDNRGPKGRRRIAGGERSKPPVRAPYTNGALKGRQNASSPATILESIQE